MCAQAHTCTHAHTHTPQDVHPLSEPYGSLWVIWPLGQGRITNTKSVNQRNQMHLRCFMSWKKHSDHTRIGNIWFPYFLISLQIIHSMSGSGVPSAVHLTVCPPPEPWWSSTSSRMDAGTAKRRGKSELYHSCPWPWRDMPPKNILMSSEMVLKAPVVLDRKKHSSWNRPTQLIATSVSVSGGFVPGWFRSGLGRQRSACSPSAWKARRTLQFSLHLGFD